MSSQTFKVNIQGYWRDVNKLGIPNHSGVYFVYTATFNKTDDNGIIHGLIYIGETDKVCDRIKDHEKYEKWKTYLSAGQELCFSTGEVEDSIRVRVEAAYIFEHKPPENTEYKYSFPFNTTTVKSIGDTALLKTDFTVNRT